MAPSKVAVEFNAMINAERDRRKNQALAQEILGKNRRSSAPGAGLRGRKPGSSPSLASRIGITKRAVSTAVKPVRTAGNVDAEWTHDLHSLNNPSPSKIQVPARGPQAVRTQQRVEKLYSVLNGSRSSPATSGQFNVVAPKKSITIRGAAGPFAVLMENLVLGTTAADVESAITKAGFVTISCQVMREQPTVTAEIVFEAQVSADGFVATFDKVEADGNILKVYHKSGSPSPLKAQPTLAPVSLPSTSRPIPPTGPCADQASARSDDSRSYSDRYVARDRERDRSREHDRGRGYDREREEVTDGNYGFEDRMEMDERMDERRFANDTSTQGRSGLYSDDLVGNRERGRGRGGSRERGRGFERGRGYR